ncbi:MAG TPA: complex I NDUFA9 subunit family protein [Casimicrobiaceae bacterium]|nr:complex I NDUFA9 subunit family protein [Casimicrobiaceae bacterium]
MSEPAAGGSVPAGRARVLVVGGSGFVGRYVVAQLSAAGHFVVVLTRRRARVRHLLLLPTVQVVEGDPHDDATLARHVRGMTAAVNLAGVLHERGRDTFARVHVELPRRLAAACRNAGVSRLLHMSALRASADAPSRYLRSKAEGEAAVVASGVAWTAFRPSVMFGREDTFLNLFASLARWSPVLPLAAANARFQPVYVADVATCFVRTLGDNETIREAYDLCGPAVYTLEELVRYVCEVSGRQRPIIRLGPALSSFQARVMEWLPWPLMTRDNLASMQVDNVCDAGFPARFGVVPAALEAIAPGYLAPSAQHSRFDAFRAHGGR